MPPATNSAVVLAPAAAAALALMVMALQLISAAAATATAVPPPPAPKKKMGLPGCDTTCGNVSVPYPFGISPGCFWPGLNLTCDRSHDPPRLLLGDGTLRVTEIDIEGATVRVVRTAGSIINTTGDSISSQGSWNVPLDRALTKYGYVLSDQNELVVLACNVVATLFTDGTGKGDPPGRIGGCASLCTKARSSGIGYDFVID